MSEQIRGLETTAHLVVDGEVKAGSFTKIEDWKITPQGEIVEQDFLGEDGFEPDQRIDGYAFSFTMQEKDNKAWELWQTISGRFLAHQQPPNVTLVIIKRYRVSSIAPQTITCQSAVIKLDDHGAGGRKDYVKTTWSGKCRRATGL